MQQYIALVILIMPGFLIRFIHTKLTFGTREKSEFEKTIYSLIYSIPVLFLNIIFIIKFTKIRNINDIISCFNSLPFLVYYILLTLCSMMFFLVLWSIIHPRYTNKIINKIRKRNGLGLIAEEESVWDIFIDNKTKNQAISIYKNGKEVAKGFIKHWSYSQNEDQEILLENEDIMDEHSECFKEVEKSYYNIDKDIMIKEYNLDKFYSKCEEQRRTCK